MLINRFQEFFGELDRDLNLFGLNRVICLGFDVRGVVPQDTQFVCGGQQIVRNNDCRP